MVKNQRNMCNRLNPQLASNTFLWQENKVKPKLPGKNIKNFGRLAAYKSLNLNWDE